MELFQTRKTSSTMKYPRAHTCACHSLKKTFFPSSSNFTAEYKSKSWSIYIFCAAMYSCLVFELCTHSLRARRENRKKKTKKERNIHTETPKHMKCCVFMCVPISKYVGKTWHEERRNWTKAKWRSEKTHTQKKRRNDMNTFGIDVRKHVVKDKYHGQIKWTPQEKAMEDWWKEAAFIETVRSDECSRVNTKYQQQQQENTIWRNESVHCVLCKTESNKKSSIRNW